MQTIRTSWQIQRAVVFALFLREMKTRFGSKRFGYLWAILEPAAVILVFWAMFGLALRGGKAIPGVDYPMFLLTGMLPYRFFSGTLQKSMVAFEANQGLFNYRQVKPLDTLITRCIVECLVYLIVFLILVVVGMALGFDARVDDFLGLSLLMVLLVCFSFGMGLILAIVGTFAETVKNVVGLMTGPPLFFTSGIFFSVSMMPPKFRGILLLNPLLNFLELIRGHYFAAFQPQGASYLYIIGWTMGSCLIGLWLYTHLKNRVVATS